MEWKETMKQFLFFFCNKKLPGKNCRVQVVLLCYRQSNADECVRLAPSGILASSKDPLHHRNPGEKELAGILYVNVFPIR